MVAFVCFMSVVNYAWLFPDTAMFQCGGVKKRQIWARSLSRWWWTSQFFIFTHTRGKAVTPQRACPRLWMSKGREMSKTCTQAYIRNQQASWWWSEKNTIVTGSLFGGDILKWQPLPCAFKIPWRGPKMRCREGERGMVNWEDKGLKES